ncbi:MAG: tyrosine-type recombinase/integrase, partial [Terriglobia bacterium]
YVDGVRYQGSTGFGDRRKAERFVEDLRGMIRLGETDERGRVPKKIEAPTLREFQERFMKAIQTRCAEKPATIEFYAMKLKRLLEFTPLADARLSQIDEGLTESFVQHRRCAVSPASVNRELATLRRALRLAYEWKLIDRVPKIKLLKGEKVRDFVLTDAQEQAYLEIAPQPLKDATLMLLDTGLRVGELLRLQWQDVRLEPIGDMFGCIRVQQGKSRNAPRALPITSRVKTMLEGRRAAATCPFVFTNETGDGPLSVFTLDDQHASIRQTLRLDGSVLHSFRHTCATRLGDAGMDAIAIMHFMGHGSLSISQRYIHTTANLVARAGSALEAHNQKAQAVLAESTFKVTTTSGTADRLKLVSGL